MQPLGQVVLDDFTDVRVGLRQHVAARNVGDEVLQFGEARAPELVGEYLRRGLEREPESPGRRLEIRLGLGRGRAGEFEPELEPAPYGAVQELGVVGGGDYNDVGRKVVDLEQERADHPLDLAG